VAGLRLERTRLSESGVFEGTGEFETLETQLVLRSVGYQSVPLSGVPFDPRTHTVPNASGRVLSPDGEPLPGEYVAGWLKRGPTGVIGTNKADAAETVQALLADLAGGPDVGEEKLPRPGLLRRPDGDEPAEPDDPAGGAAVRSALAPVLETRGVSPVSYADWLRISAAEEDLAAALGRGDRVKLSSRDEVWSAARPGSR
jgi:ferredoxin--NADP+ reductase